MLIDMWESCFFLKELAQSLVFMGKREKTDCLFPIC
jgi:hypothetical protein